MPSPREFRLRANRPAVARGEGGKPQKGRGYDFRSGIARVEDRETEGLHVGIGSAARAVARFYRPRIGVPNSSPGVLDEHRQSQFPCPRQGLPVGSHDLAPVWPATRLRGRTSNPHPRRHDKACDHPESSGFANEDRVAKTPVGHGLIGKWLGRINCSYLYRRSTRPSTQFFTREASRAIGGRSICDERAANGCSGRSRTMDANLERVPG